MLLRVCLGALPLVLALCVWAGQASAAPSPLGFWNLNVPALANREKGAPFKGATLEVFANTANKLKAQTLTRFDHNGFENVFLYETGNSVALGLPASEVNGSAVTITEIEQLTEGAVGTCGSKLLYIALHGTISEDGNEMSGAYESGFVQQEIVSPSVEPDECLETISPDGHESGNWSATRPGAPLSKATISGDVKDGHAVPAGGVKLELSGTSDTAGKAVSQTVIANGFGEYSFKVEPGTYVVKASGEPTLRNGGTLTVRKSPLGAHEPECPGQATGASCALEHVGANGAALLNFTYTECAAATRTVNNKQASGCPIIFIPGFLGSRLFCGGHEEWTGLPTPDFANLLLLGDGTTNAGAPGSCSAASGPISGQEGVVSTAAFKDIYGNVLAYLNRIAPSHIYALPYDWRKSPLIAKEALGKLVDEVLTATGAKHVVLVAHSMGGLVLQSFIAEAANADKVARAVTLGTPYWGAVKSHVALLTGKSNEVTRETFGLDLFIKNNLAKVEAAEGVEAISSAANDLQRAARNMQGLYWLYPADQYGPWLQVIGPGYPAGAVPSSQSRAWVASLGGSPQLVTNAVAGHTAITGYPANGVDLQVVAGAGTPTESAMKIELNPATETQPVAVWYASGDGTVPLVSATEGASEGIAVKVPVHYVCRVDHVAIPADETVQAGIEEFLLRDDPIVGLEDNCPYTGQALDVFEPVIPEHGTTAPRTGAKASATKRAVITVQSAGATISLGEAVERGLVTTLQAGGSRFIADTTGKPVTINVSGSAVAVSVHSIKSGRKGNETGNGPTALYGPVRGSLTIGPSGVVKHGSRTLKPVRARRAPHTTAHVARHGRHLTVRLTARSGAGIAATYVRIGRGKVKLYTRPFVITVRQLRSLRFESVDRFGRFERPQRVRR